MIPAYESEIQRRDIVKTSFSLSAKALEDIQYLVERRDMTAGALLDFLCGELGRSSTERGEGMSFLSLSIEAAQDVSPEWFARKSFSVSSKAIVALKTLKRRTGVSRDVMLDSAIRTYRRLTDYEHPVAIEELRKLDAIMDEISDPTSFLRSKGIFIHDFYHPLSSDPDEQAYDAFLGCLREFAAEVRRQVQSLQRKVIDEK